MKKIFPSLLINVCLLVAGFSLFFVYQNKDFLTYVAMILGLIFMLPSLVYVGMVCFKNHENEKSNTELIGLLPSAGGFCFGVVLILHPELFTQALSIIFSILLIALGLSYIIYNYIISSRCDIKPWYYIAPVIITIAGIVTLLIKQEDSKILVLCMAISFILASFSGFLTNFAEQKALMALKNTTENTESNETEEKNDKNKNKDKGSDKDKDKK